MPNIKENRAKVYKALTERGFSGIGADESEFSALMDKEENRVKVYDALSRKGLKGIGKDYDEFSSLMYAPEEVAKKETVEPYKFGETIQGMYKPMEQATGMMPVEGSIHKTESGYARTNIPYQTEEFSSLENAREAERMQHREDALAAYKSAYNRLEKPGEVDEKTLIEWGNDMTKAPTEQKDLYRRVTGADATSRVDLDMLMRSIDETAKNLDTENAKELAVYLSMSPERQASLAPEEREKYEGWIKDVRKKEAVKGTDELFTRIADLKEKQRVSDIKAYNEYEKNRGVGGWVKDALLGIPVAEAPHMKGKIPSSGFDISPEGVASKEANDALTAAGRYYNKSQKMIQAAQSGNFFQAMDDALNDVDTWSPEVILQDNLAIQRVANKYEEEGEGALTENEKALLDALAMNAAVTELYSGDISNWTNAGTMVGQMAPFMIEMVLNPLSGLSRKAAAAVTKRAVKKYGAEALKKGLKNVTLGATRGLAKAGGAVVGGTGMALTTGLPAVAADTQKRMLGEATYGYEDGKVKYTGHTEGEGLFEAAGGAIASRAIDNATDMFGAEYASKLMKGVLKPLAKTKVGGWLDNLANSRFGKAAANFSEKTNWNGPIEEFLEEMHAGLLGAAAGEHKLSEFFTKDNIATIAIGVSVPGVAMSAMNTVQGIKDGAFKAGAQERWKMENADAIATRLWQNPAEWKDLRNSLTVGTLEETEEKLKEVYNDKNLTPEQKVRAFEYAIYNLQYRTARNVAEGYSENAKKMIDPMLRDIYGTSFAEYVSPRQANKAFKAMEEAGKRATESLGLQDMSIEDWLNGRTVEEATRGNKALAEALQAYLNAKADFEGKRDRFQFERERAYTEADNSIDEMSNNGMVYSTEMDGEEVFITGGNVVLNENGTVDIENSSEVLYIRRPDGSVRSVACENIPGEVTAENAENLKAARRAEIDEKWKADFEAAEAEPASQGVDQVAPVAQQNPNDFTLELEGEQYHVQVEDGVVKVDGEPVEWDAQTLADARAKAGIPNEEAKAESGDTLSPVEQAELSNETMQPQVELTPKQKREEVAKRIPMKGKERAWTEAEPADVVEYISLLTEDPAKQQAAVDKYVADIKAKQEKADAITALEMEEDIAFWENVKQMLAERNVNVKGESGNVAEVAPVVEPAYTEEEIADAQAFVKASSANTTEAYQEYLDNYPEGAYRNGARGGIWMIEGTNPETHGEVVDARNAAMEVLKSVDESKPTGDTTSPVDEKQPLRDRAQEWTAKTGIPVMLIETEAEVTNEDARKALKEGRDVTGWFEAKSGAVALYMPHLHSAKDVDLTYIHEVVVHKGLRALMGDKFDALCDKVWESMSEDARSRFLDYVGEKFNSELERQRAAADEYMAFIAEGVDLTEADKTVWDKIVEFFREFVESFGTKLTDAEIETLIKASYANLKNMQEKSSGDTVENGYRERRTFHGSGAQFDKFDHSFMGSGEGAQAFGWGTYVTEVEGIGRSYAGVGVTKLGPLQAKLGNIDSAINSLEKEVQKAEKDLTSDNETARRIATYLLETADEKRKALEEEKAAVEDEIKSYRNLYTVEIPDDNGSNYLHWDERIPMNVVNSIKKRLFDVLAEGDYKGVEKELKRELDDVFKADNNDGNLIYGNISAYLGGDKAASLFLNDMGFVGISYPAEAMTGGRADGARNYVIFNENDAQIESRTMFRIAKTPQEFDATQKEAVEKRGIVAPNLNSAVVNVGDVPRHDFTGTGSEAISKAKQWAKENLVGEYTAKKGTNDEFNYSIDEKSIKKYLSGVSTGLSDNLGVHLSVLKVLPDVIDESIEVEIHADYKKGEGRSIDNGIDDENLLIHRLYGAAYINGDMHRIKTTLKERKADGVKPYTYEVTKIELLGGSSHKGTSSSDAPNNSIPATKLLNGVEKSYDKGKFILEESENSPAEVNPQDSEIGIRFRKVTDPAKIAELEASPKRTGYRNVVLNEDGSLGSPMADSLKGTGKGADRVKTETFKMNEWEEAEENPSLADENSKITLVKPSGNAVAKVDYNPYIHNRLDPVNLQFKDAWKRDDLVYVETEVAETDLNSGYHADKAVKPVGVHSWSNGALMLSRYDKPVRILPWDEVADAWAKRLNGKGVNFDRVPAAMRELLVERGVEILPPTKGMGEDVNDAYRAWKEAKNGTRFRVTPAMDAEYMSAVENGDMETAQRMVKEAAKRAMPDTKVVDENEFPKVVYHRTPNEFTIFDPEKIGASTDAGAFGSGFYLSPADFGPLYGKNLMPLFVNLKNPLMLNDANAFETKEPFYGEDYSWGKEQAENFNAWVKENGYDGVWYENNGRDEIVAFEPNQIKSADAVTYDDNGNVISLSDRFNEEKNDIRFRKANKNQEVFVSNAKKAVEEIKQEKATPEQWLAMIKKNGGLKAGEDKWMGLSEWLEEKGKLKGENGKTDPSAAGGSSPKTGAQSTVTKQEILDFIGENKIQIEEVNYTQFGYGLIDEAKRKLEAELKEIGWDAMVEKYPGFDELFEVYDGELLWSEERASVGEYEDFIIDNKIVDLDSQSNAINETREKYTTEGLENKREIALVVPTVEPYNVSDEIHFGDAGNGRAVAWVRFGETTDSEGNRVLVIDEIQSKRHQDGREKGYKDTRAYEREKKVLDEKAQELFQRRKELIESLNNKYGSFTNYLKSVENGWVSSLIPNEDVMTPEEIKEYNETSQDGIIKEEAALKEKFRDGVPAAPFEKNWQELAMKRMLRLAAEEGFDKVAWTTGEQQAERYNIAKVVSHIECKKVGKNGNKSFSMGLDYKFIVDPNGIVVSSKDEYIGKSIADIVGKPLANKMLEMQEGDTISGDGLRIGGEGMKGFYDRMLPSFVSKYTKKWGAKVGEVEMPSLEQNNVMHSVDVTPEMKESVMEGQTMFRFTDADRQAIDFRRTHRGSANIVVIDADMMTADLLAHGFNAEEIVKIRELHKKGSVGFYNIDRNTIYLLGKNLGREENEGTFWHENTHKAIVDLDVPQEILDEFYSMPSEEFIKKFEELAIKGYNPEDYPEEFMAYYIEHVRDSGRHERSIEIMGVAPEKVERVAQIVEPIINYINYGRRRVDTGTERVSKESGNLRDSGVETLPRGEKEGTRLRDTRFHERESIDDIPTQPLTLVERVKNSLLEAAAKNKENLQLRADALRTYGRDVANVLKLMGKQREYDKSTVDTLMKLVKMYFKHAQLLGEVTPYEVTRIMGALNRAVGKRDITNEANTLMNILLDAHAKALDGILEKAEKIKAKKVNAAGVEVMGSLDKYAQETIGTYRDSKGWEQQILDESIIDSANRLAEAEDKVREALGLSPVDDIDAALDGYVPATPAAENAIEVCRMERARFEGFDLAREYRENVHHYKTEISQLNQELKDAGLEVKKGNIDRRAYNELKRSIEDAIMQSKAEMIDGYHGVISRFTEDVRGGRARAKQFVQEQVDRARDIQHNANSDMEGNPANVQGAHPDKWNGSVPRLFMSAMPTFQNMLKKFGEKAVDGKGYLYTRFMPQATQAADKEFRGKVSARLLIEAKLEGIYDKKMSIEKFMNLSRKHGVTISYKEGGVEKSFDLNKGQMLYIYMVNKMTDGQMKLRKMGITEELVADIAERLDPEMVIFADWAQNELLTDLRGKYNEVHERMFGAPMASIDNYFPLKIKKEARGEKVDNGRQDAEEKPSTVTGSIIKRTKNATAIDLSADAMSVLIEHIDNMEHWAAFAEFNRDLNTLLNYRHFQNQVKGMTTIRYGSGDVLWKNFQKVAAIASGEYRPKTSEVDKAVMNIAKGITRSKINFRIYTAAKQLLSAPAFWNEAGFMELMKTYRNPWGSFKWAKENLPGFKERWEGRTMGNEKLMPDESDWKVWRNKFVENATKWGMTPNAAIDAMTVAQGARAVYLTKLQQLKKAGFSHEQANAKALQAAAEAYNESQQSSEGAYLAPIQKDGTVASAILTTFKNSDFGYTRKTAQAASNILRKMKKGYKEETIAFMAKKLEREGLTPEQAKAYATKIYKKSKYKDVVDVAMFCFGLNILWELGGVAIYLMAGDDDETKEKMRKEAALRGSLGVLNGIPGGETIASGAMAVVAGDANLFRLPELVAVGDVRNLVKVLDTDMVKGVTDLINLLTAAGIGVNPQVITDLFVAIDDFDPEEFGMFVLRAMAAPTSQTEQLEVDKAMEDNGKRLEEIAVQYVEYKKKRQTPLTGWMYTDEGEQKAMERYAGRFDKMLDERLEKVVENTDEYQDMYEHSNPYMKEKLSKMRKAYLEGNKEVTFEKLEIEELINRKVYGANYKDTNVGYFNLTTSEDEDMAFLIDEKLKALKPVYDEAIRRDGEEFYNAHKEEIDLYVGLNDIKNAVNANKKLLKVNPTEEAMNEIRRLRNEAIDLINHE